MENVKPGLLPAPLQEGVGIGALMEGNIRCPFFQEKLWTLLVSLAQISWEKVKMNVPISRGSRP